MTVDIKPIDPVNRAVLRGRRLGPRPAQAADARRSRQPSMPAWTSSACWCSTTSISTDEQQLAFSRNFGPLEQATGDIASAAGPAPEHGPERHLQPRQEQQLLARDDRRRLFGLGNQLWHSDSSFKAVPAKYSLLSARQHPAGRRQHRVRRHARRLRRARRGDQGEVRGPGLRAQPDLLARHPGLHRLHRRGARASSRRCASAWCAAIR